MSEIDEQMLSEARDVLQAWEYMGHTMRPLFHARVLARLYDRLGRGGNPQGMTTDPRAGDVVRNCASRHAQAEAGGGVPENRAIKMWCDTCDGQGDIDTSLGGDIRYASSDSECPDCSGKGYNVRQIPSSPPTASVSRDSGCEVTFDTNNASHIQDGTYDYSKDKIVSDPKYGSVPLPARDELQVALQKLTEAERESASVPTAENGRAPRATIGRDTLPLTQPFPHCDQAIDVGVDQVAVKSAFLTSQPTASVPDRVKVLEDALRWWLDERMAAYTEDQYGKRELRKALAGDAP